MSEYQTFPYDGWILTPSYKPKKLTFTRQVVGFGPIYQQAVGGRLIKLIDIYPTKEDAIEAGFKKLKMARERLQKMEFTLSKREITLVKAKVTP